jgi:DNA polymerase-3 subunit alpha
LGCNRRQLVSSYEGILESISREKKSNIEGQVNLFDTGLVSDSCRGGDYSYPDLDEFDPQRLLKMEKELLGIYLSGNPLDEYAGFIEKNATFFSRDKLMTGDGAQLAETSNFDGRHVICAGMIGSITKKITKNNNMMAFVELEDIYGSLELIVFPTVFERFNGLIAEDAKILVKGKLSMREDEEIKVICEEIQPLKSSSRKDEPGKDRIPEALYVNADAVDMDRLLAFLTYFGGEGTKVVLRKSENGKKYEKTLGNRYAIPIDDDTVGELESLAGSENIFLKMT